MKSILNISAFLLLSTFAFNHSFAQLVELYDIDATKYPIVKAKFYSPIKQEFKPDLKVDDLKIFENNIPMKITDLKCYQSNKPNIKSVALSFDVSGSMTWFNSDILVKDFAKKLITISDFANSEMALQESDLLPRILTDFMKSKAELFFKLSNVIIENGMNNFKLQLIDSLAGLFPISSHGKKTRYAVILTDAMGVKLEYSELLRMQNYCKINDIIFCAIITKTDLDLSSPAGIYTSFKELAESTGGKIITDISTKAEAENAAVILNNFMEGISSYCEVTWLAEKQCDTLRRVKLEIDNPQKMVSVEKNYASPIQIKEPSIAPLNINFGATLPNNFIDTTITIQASSDLIITNISSDNAYFSILTSNLVFPISLKQGESKKITIRFAPLDSGYCFARIIIDGDLCLNKYVFCSGGFIGKKSTIKSNFKLTYPNGGEVLQTLQNCRITWSNSLPSARVLLEYSLDKGSSWNFITDSAKNYFYDWETPDTVSRNCLIRGNLFSQDEDLRVMLSSHLGICHSGEISLNGGRTATSGVDYVMLWDTYTGRLIKKLELENISDEGNFGADIIRFNNTGEKLFIADKNQNIIQVHDGFTGDSLQTYYIGNGSTSVRIYDLLSTDKGIIALYHMNNKFTVKNIESDNILIELNDNFDYGLKLSPNANFSVFTDSNTVIINNSSGKRELIIPFKLNYTNLRFSDDGSRMLISYSDSVLIYDTKNWLVVDKINIDKAFNFAISKDLSLLATDAGQYVGRVVPALWDLKTLKRIPNKKAFEYIIDGVVMNMSFSSDNKKLLLCYSTGQSIVLNLDDAVIANDQSDTLFSIIRPYAEALNILDMGQVLVGEQKDSLVQTFITNKSDVNLKIDSVVILGRDAKEFRAIAVSSGFELLANKSRSIEFSFLPLTQGLKYADVFLYSRNITYQTKIRGEGILPVLNLPFKIIDFGGVELSDNKDTTLIAAIQNVGTAPIFITSLSNNGIDNSQFSLLSSGSSFWLQPNESKQISVRFSPKQIGRTNGAISINYNGFGSPAQIFLYGQGLGGKVSLTHDSAFVGDKINLPLLLSGPRKYLHSSNTTKFFVELNYSNSVLFSSKYSTSKLVGNNRIITYNGEWDGASDTITKFPMSVCLGDTDYTEVAIKKFNWLNEKGEAIDYEVPTQDGSLKVLNICRSGGNHRFIESSGLLYLKVIQTDNFNKDISIKYATVEDGLTKIYITNSLGEKVAELINGELKRGEYELTSEYISNIKLGSGFYNCIMQTPNDILSQKIFISN